MNAEKSVAQRRRPHKGQQRPSSSAPSEQPFQPEEIKPMETKRCGHFSIEVELLPIAEGAVVLRVPIRRCALAERMIALISETEAGREVARKLTIATHARSENRQESAQERLRLDAEMIRVAFGPDLEAIHPGECTIQRCQESCTPSYKLLLSHFGCDEAARQETGDGCLGLTETDR